MNAELNEFIKSNSDIFTDKVVDLFKNRITQSADKRAISYAGGQSIATYILTMNKERQEHLTKRYPKYFNKTEENFSDLFFEALRYKHFVIDPSKISLDRANVRPEFRHLVRKPDTWVVTPTFREVSHSFGVASVLLNFLNSEYKYALFLEDDIDFIKMKDDKVMDKNGGVLEWNNVPPYDVALQNYEQSPEYFQTTFTSALEQAEEDHIDFDILFLGSTLSVTRGHKTITSVEGTDVQLVVPKCPLGVHAVVFTRESAKRSIITLLTWKLPTDNALYSRSDVKLVEIKPNIVGQQGYFEIYKGVNSGVKASSIGHDYTTVKWLKWAGACFHTNERNIVISIVLIVILVAVGVVYAATNTKRMQRPKSRKR